MPIADRKFYISMHNREQEGNKERSEHGKDESSVYGEALNAYAKIEQTKAKNGVNFI